MKQRGHFLIVLIFLICLFTFAVAVLMFPVLRAAEERRAEQTQRINALLCWHEFETGRRATTADCPGL